MHMMLDQKNRRDVETRTLLNLPQRLSVENHVRAMAGNSGGYVGELTHNCCLYDVIVHHDVPLVTSPNNTYNLT